MGHFKDTFRGAHFLRILATFLSRLCVEPDRAAVSKEVLVATAVVDADESAGRGDLIGVIVHPEDDRVLDEAVLADGVVACKE